MSLFLQSLLQLAYVSRMHCGVVTFRMSIVLQCSVHAATEAAASCLKALEGHRRDVKICVHFFDEGGRKLNLYMRFAICVALDDLLHSRT